MSTYIFRLIRPPMCQIGCSNAQYNLDKTDSAETPVEEELILAVFDTIKYKYEQF